MLEQLNKLHLGCASKTPGGWINLDGSWNAWLAKYPAVRRVFRVLRIVPASRLDSKWSPDILIHDVRKSLPFQDNSLDVIYASHLLEHLYLNEAKGLLRECFRVLKPGGVLRMVVPDLRAIALEYMCQKRSGETSMEMETTSPADILNERLYMRSQDRPSRNIIYRIYTALKDFHSHKWMYDADSLINHFNVAGFAEVQEMAFHQSRIIKIEQVEDAGRVLKGAGICVEGVKPGIVQA